MAIYVAEPVQVEAVFIPELIRKLEDSEYLEVPEWVLYAIGTEGLIVDYNKRTLKITTLEGIMSSRPDDYVVQGVCGELYPCRKDAFELKYRLKED